MKYKNDVIIIGSGLGGLSAGAYLSRCGYKITIFERLAKPGGVVHTFNRGKYVFEASTHQLCGLKNKLYLKHTLNLLGIKDLQIREHDYSFEALIFGDKINKKYLIKSGYEKSLESLLSYFPDHKSLLIKHYKIFKCISTELLRLKRLQRDLPLKFPIDSITALMLKNYSKNVLFKSIGFNYYRHFMEYRNKSAEYLLKEINNHDLKNILSQHCFYMGLDLKRAPAYLLAMMIYLYIINKPVSIIGGTNKLLEELISIILKNNGDICYNSKVEKIIIRNEEACGIRLNNSEEYYSKYVISDTTAENTYERLVPFEKRSYNKYFQDKLDRYKSSKSCFQVYIGLTIDIKDYGFNACTSFFSPSDNPALFPGDYPHPSDNSPFILTNYKKSNPEFFDEDYSTIVIEEFDNIDRWINLSNEEYNILKNETEKIILDKIKRLTDIPFEKIEMIFSSTPMTISHYSGNPYGSMFGAEQNLDQSFLNRFEQISPVKNLFLTGTDSKPTSGVSACIDSGVLAGYCLKNYK